MGNLGVDTAVEGGDGRWTAAFSSDWEIWGPNGGYLAAIALRAAGEVAQIARPSSFSCHFLSSPAFAAVELEVTVLKAGRRAESLQVAMTQDGRPVLHALVKTLAEAPGHAHAHAQAPDVAPPQELRSYEQLLSAEQRPPFAFWENIERRPIDQVRPPDGAEPVLREWARYRPTPCFSDPFVDAARALILLDTYGFPAAYRRFRSMEYLAPNLDTSAWFHQFSPDREWLLVDHACTIAAAGLMAVDGKVWDEDGRLLASGAAHLCCIPAPTGRGQR